MSNIHPKLNAMLLCDSIITEAGTNKKSLIGIFENIATEKFPCKHFQLSVYIKFTSAQGKYTFRLELVNLANNAIIGKGEIPELNIPDKLGSYELAFNLLGLKFDQEGKYDFRIFADDKFFGNKAFSVVKAPQLPVK
ncbi:MAG: hypothetical protein ABIH08_06965 [Candidatus Omnitrophota bacterium]